MHIPWLPRRTSVELLNSNCSGWQHRVSPAAICWFNPQSWPKPRGLLLGGSENFSYCTGTLDLLFLFCFCPRFHPNYLSWYLGKHIPPFHKKFRNVYVQWAMSLVIAQNGEQVKTNVLKYDRGATLLIRKVLMKLSNWEKQDVGHAKKRGQKPCSGWTVRSWRRQNMKSPLKISVLVSWSSFRFHLDRRSQVTARG